MVPAAVGGCGVAAYTRWGMPTETPCFSRSSLAPAVEFEHAGSADTSHGESTKIRVFLFLCLSRSSSPRDCSKARVADFTRFFEIHQETRTDDQPRPTGPTVSGQIMARYQHDFLACGGPSDDRRISYGSPEPTRDARYGVTHLPAWWASSAKRANDTDISLQGFGIIVSTSRIVFRSSHLDPRLDSWRIQLCSDSTIERAANVPENIAPYRAWQTIRNVECRNNGTNRRISGSSCDLVHCRPLNSWSFRLVLQCRSSEIQNLR